MDPRKKADWIQRIHCSNVPQEHLSETYCPICGHKERQQLAEERGYPLWKCENCSHVYISPRPSQHWLNELYSSTYMPDSSDEEDWEQYLDRVFEATAKAIRNYHPQLGELLDVGTGFGGFLVRAGQDGWKLHGLEPNESAFNVAKSRLNGKATLYQSIFETADLQPESFDGIVMMNVIEHVRDPIEICRRAYELLRPGGFLGLRWPQMSWMKLRRRKKGTLTKTDNAIIGAPIHLHDYTDQSMKKLMATTGYQDVQHCWAGTRRQPGLSWKMQAAAQVATLAAYTSQRLSGGRLITPFIARLSLGRKPVS